MSLPGFPDAMPIEGLLGGLLIGLAGAIMLLGLGRIAGVSGLAARSVGIAGSSKARALAIAFILGLPAGAWMINRFYAEIEVHFPASPLPLIIGGLLVGFGTRLGSGCTSGHGVCGVSRLSPRSMVATALFMATGFATVGLMRLFGFMS
ncbi:hypothetical protein AQ1_01116 [alpha proteobacterium Q-1]|nr:hypothetical protein AQ1_01116 [alpha proteobacterium Q-1]